MQLLHAKAHVLILNRFKNLGGGGGVGVISLNMGRLTELDISHKMLI